MHDTSDAGPEECTTGYAQDMRNVQYNMRYAGHEECRTRVMQDMRNAPHE